MRYFTFVVTIWGHSEFCFGALILTSQWGGTLLHVNAWVCAIHSLPAMVCLKHAIDWQFSQLLRRHLYVKTFWRCLQITIASMWRLEFLKEVVRGWDACLHWNVVTSSIGMPKWRGHCPAPVALMLLLMLMWAHVWGDHPKRLLFRYCPGGPVTFMGVLQVKTPSQ